MWIRKTLPEASRERRPVMNRTRVAAWRITMLSCVLAFGVACSEQIEPGNPPADHTVSQDGFRHAPDFCNPIPACTACHGADLRGGEGPSCFTCHDDEWTSSDDCAGGQFTTSAHVHTPAKAAILVER